MWYWRTRHYLGYKRVWGPFPWRWLALTHHALCDRYDHIKYGFRRSIVWTEYSEPYHV